MNIPGLANFKARISKKSGLRSHTQPQRDWFMVIGVGFVALLLSAVWSYWSSLTATTASSVVTEVRKMDTGVQSLRVVKDIFDKRDAEREKYRSGYHFVDPLR